jgi:hypothetical protein
VNRTSIEKWTVPVAAVEAAATGLVLIVSPPFFAWLVLGAELSDAGQALGRLGGIALLGAGLGAWSPPATGSHPLSSVRALAIYNLLATLYLGYLALATQLMGVLLWPAIALHAIFAALVTPAWQRRAAA